MRFCRAHNVILLQLLLLLLSLLYYCDVNTPRMTATELSVIGLPFCGFQTKTTRVGFEKRTRLHCRRLEPRAIHNATRNYFMRDHTSGRVNEGRLIICNWTRNATVTRMPHLTVVPCRRCTNVYHASPVDLPKLRYDMPYNFGSPNSDRRCNQSAENSDWEKEI